VYVEQPLGFEDHQHPNLVFKLKNALYGLKQAPRQWLNNQRMEFSYVNQSIAKKSSRNLRWRVASKLAHLCLQAVI